MDRIKDQKQRQEAKQRPSETSQASEGQRLLTAMQSGGYLVEDEVAEPEEIQREAQLPPYGSKEEAELFEELASELTEALQAEGTTIADEISLGRGE